MHDSLKPEEMAGSGQPLSIAFIELTDGKTVHFDQDSLGFAAYQDSSVSRTPPGGAVEAYPLSEISKVHTVRPSTTGEDIAIAASISGCVLLLLLVSLSTVHFSFGG